MSNGIEITDESDPPVLLWCGNSRQQAEKISQECYKTLTKIFGHKEYKGKQKAIVEAAVQGADVFVLAPTGMGKSLCYQVPAVCQKTGVTLVVSPLLALMKNQVESLTRKGIAATSLSSETSQKDKKDIIADMKSARPRWRLLYMTPERMNNNDFLNILVRLKETDNLNRLVVDEAHCISEWGHDFRADYRSLGKFRKQFPDVPIMALTATATPTVQEDIIRSLRMEQDRLFRADHPFNRKNLFYEVRYQSSPEPVSQMNDVADFITTLYRRRGETSAGVIYCRKKVTCNDLAEFLRRKSVKARPYHRDIKNDELDRTLQDWTNGNGVDVVVATIAFGLGIDKGDVRYIVHYDLPKSFEGYYQETGRAGRDGLPAKCVLYYSRQDAREASRLVANSHEQRVVADGPPPSQRSLSSLAALIEAVESTTVCRHVAICRYFGEEIDAKDPAVLEAYCDKMCDICKYPEKTMRRAEKLTGQAFIPDSGGERNNGWQTSREDGDSKIVSAHQLPKFTRPKDGGGSLGMTKRSRSGPTNDESSTKKPKYEALPPAMETKPHTSARSLAKPFRPPLMRTTTPNVTSSRVTPVVSPATSNKKSSQEPQLPVEEDVKMVEDESPPPDSDEYFELKELEPIRELTPELTPSQEFREESPLLPPPRQAPSSTSSRSSMASETDCSVEAPYSEKIDLHIRQTALNEIKRGLYTLFIPTPSAISELWGRLGTAKLSKETKVSIVNKATTTLEFRAFCLSRTEPFYQRRIADTVEAIKGGLKAYLLKGPSSKDSDEEEEVKDVVDTLRTIYGHNTSS